MTKNSVVITSACRTAVGSLGKSLKNVKAEDLGSAVISESITKSNIKPSDLDENNIWSGFDRRLRSKSS